MQLQISAEVSIAGCFRTNGHLSAFV